MNKKQQNIVTSKSTNTVAIFLLSNPAIIDAWPSKDHEKWKFTTNTVNIFHVNSKLIPYSHQPKGALFTIMGTKLTMPGKPCKPMCCEWFDR
jgi:hypothetical protein